MTGAEIDLQGRTCLITGANSGLGKAIAVEMAGRGATVIMACRRQYTDALMEIKERSKNENVSLRMVDLSSLKSVHSFCDRLRDDDLHIDVVFMNAGIASSENVMSDDGFSLLWQVNYLSNAVMLMRMLWDNVIPNTIFATSLKKGTGKPRILFTSSSRHREELDIRFENFGVFDTYNLTEVFKWYGLSKLYLMTFAWELGRRLMIAGRPDVSVHSFCPGPFRSGIGRGAGWIGKLAINMLPTSAEKAAYPAIHLATAQNLEGVTLQYMHKGEFEQPDPRVMDRKIGERLWQETLQCIRQSFDTNS